VTRAHPVSAGWASASLRRSLDLVSVRLLGVRVLAGTGAGFLLAVLWMDLMFDVQARGLSRHAVPIDAVRSIRAYYARVTTAARPMNRLIALMMLMTVGALVAEVVRGDFVAWRAWASLGLAVVAVGLAGVRTVPNAVRLGRAVEDASSVSARLAQSILHDHVVCFAAIVSVLLLQVLPT
jgi:hypothetical protein